MTGNVAIVIPDESLKNIGGRQSARRIVTAK